MSEIEKSKLIQLLMEQRDDLKKLQEEMRQREEKSSREREALLQRIAELMDQIYELTRLLKEKENARLLGRLNAGK